MLHGKAYHLFFAASAFVWLFSACGEEKRKDPCEPLPELCPQEGVHRCTADKLGFQTCQRNLDGCLIWSDPTACGERKSCRSTGTDAVCQCNNECTQAGETTCSDDKKILRVCQADPANCLYLQDQENCSQSGKVCYDSPKPAVCELPCSNKCLAGSSRCSGSVIETCALVDRCRDWVAGADCSLENKICQVVSGSARCESACSHQCTAVGDTRCSERIVQTCVVGQNGCRQWSDTTDCAQENKYCNESGQEAVCVEQCSNVCDTENATRCQPGTQTIQTCTTGQNGCRDWLATTNCADLGKTCSESGGAASCVDSCTDLCSSLGSTRCDGNDIQTCQLDQQTGCRVWAATASCSGDTPLCDDSTGSALCVCEDTCSSASSRHCQANILEICAADGDADPCLEWKQMQDCEAAGKSCDDNLSPPACCAHQCDSTNATRCDPSPGSQYVQTCQADDDGCRFWDNTTDCAAGGKVCVDSGGSAECN